MDRNLTILIAEDSEDDALLLKRAFRKIGLKNPFHILTDGAEVLKYLKGEGQYEDRQQYPFPSVLFTDVKMPRVSGFDILQWLREHPECRVIPTIVFSSSDETNDVTKAYELGANAYFVKPSSLGELEEMLRYAYEFWARCAKPPVPKKCV
jgi:CheY-like chemotaxis protein